MSRTEKTIALFWATLFVFNAVNSIFNIVDDRYDRATYHTVMWTFAVVMLTRLWDRRQS